MAIQPRSEAIVMTPKCFSCLPLNDRVTEIRRKCVARGFHRPSGDPIEHSCSTKDLYRCPDCGTLVAKV